MFVNKCVLSILVDVIGNEKQAFIYTRRYMGKLNLEAMRQGLYILATDTGAIPEMIQPEFGQLITREPSEIAETIADVIENGRVSMMAKNASRMYFLKHFTLESMMSGYAKTLISL